MDKLKAGIWKHILLGHDLDFILYDEEKDERGYFHGAIKPDRIQKITIKCLECNEIILETYRTSYRTPIE